MSFSVMFANPAPSASYNTVRPAQTNRRVTPFLAMLLTIAACSDSSSPLPVPAALSFVGASHLEGTVGSAVAPRPAVRVSDSQGRPLRFVEVDFLASGGGGAVTGGNQFTDANGIAAVGAWVLGQTAGANMLVAQVQDLAPLVFTAEAAPGPAVTIAFLNTPFEITENKVVAPAITVELRDQFGNRATRSTANITLSLNQNPPNTTIAGTTDVQTIGGLATFSDIVFSAPDLSAPVVNSVTPPIMSSGAAMRITGQGFGATPSQNIVLVDGLPSNISNGSVGELNIIAPTFTGECEPTRHVLISIGVRVPLFVLRLRASSVGFSNSTSELIGGLKTTETLHPVRTAPQLPLAVGQSHITQTEAESRCLELPAAPAKYFISVFSTNSSSISSTPFALRGKPSSLLLAAGAAPLRSAARSAQSESGAGTNALAYSQSQQPAARLTTGDAHTRMLQENVRILRETPHPLRYGTTALSAAARASLATLPALASSTVGTVGGVNEFRYSFSSCGEGYTTILGRTAWVGSHAIIVEDTEPFGVPQLNGTLDARYAEIGSEFDATGWQLVLQHFGNPLLVDSQMDNHGKVIMLFSPKVTASGAQAFVFSCDFFPRSTFPKSNQAPIFYARVPTILPPPFNNPSTPDGWQRVTRSTVVHEVKHIASYAERIVRSGLAGFEEPWLEEGGARIAEELFGRTFYGNAWKSNSTYLQTFFCDLRPEQPGCETKPLIMAKHFGAIASPPALYDFLERTETSSLFCINEACADASYYASSWSMIRWAMDHLAVSETAFLNALTQSSAVSGASNLEALTNLPWPTLLGEWSLMLATDDLPGFSPLSARLRMPSWNLRAVFGELHTEFPQKYLKPYPLTPHSIGYNDFFFQVPTLLSGGFSLFELSGPQAGSQVVHLRGLFGGAPSSNLRVAIVRVE